MPRFLKKKPRLLGKKQGLAKPVGVNTQAGLVTAPERIHRVQTRTCMPLPPEVAILTRCRFGSQRLLFLLLAWLTLLPVFGPFPQIAHFFDITKLL
jgi:hypothetical protein